MKLSQAATAMHGELLGEDNVFSWVSTDTRSIQAGELFIALHGDNFNGEAFIAAAIKKGACAVVVAQYVADITVPQLVVDDTTKALGMLAKYKRSCLTGRVVAITGSCGKTSVKGMLNHILQGCGKTAATKGNLNNHIGVPLTIMSTDDDVDFLIVEAGTSGVGEIQYLTDIINPDVAVVVNVHSTHIEGFGTVDAIATEKSSIYGAAAHTTRAVVNKGLLRYPEFEMQIAKAEAVVFSQDAEEHDVFNGIRVTASKCTLNAQGQACFSLRVKNNSVLIELNVPGEHQIENALAAAGCAIALGVSLDDIQSGLMKFNGVNGRMQFLPAARGTLIDDTYNASPASMRAAIDYLSQQSLPVLVVGDMGELGSNAKEEHVKIGQYAAEKGVQSLLCVGRYAYAYAEGFGENAQQFNHQEDIVTHLKNVLNDSNTVLVKGSRTTKMENVSLGLCIGETH